MSSLMQHHGVVENGKVELLFYLTHPVETSPLRCQQCSHEWFKCEAHCRNCGRFVLFVTEHHPSGPDTEVLTMQDAIESEAWSKLKSPNGVGTDKTCYVSNWWQDQDSEPVEFTRPNGTKTTCAKLYRIWRKPAGMSGCWVQFRYNGEVHVPDLSVPIGTRTLPRDAEELTHQEAADYWFST